MARKHRGNRYAETSRKKETSGQLRSRIVDALREGLRRANELNKT